MAETPEQTEAREYREMIVSSKIGDGIELPYL